MIQGQPRKPTLPGLPEWVITMKRRILVICFGAALFLAALGLTLYPVVSNYVNRKYASEIFTAYQEVIAQTDNSVLVQEREKAAAYNQTLLPGTTTEGGYTQEALQSASEEYDSILNLSGDGIMGYIEIPKINVHLPIYHGTGDSSLSKGVGHLLGSSLPVGGASTHSILSGHSGMASQTMFTDLEQLGIGDVFYLYVLDDVLAYVAVGARSVEDQQHRLTSSGISVPVGMKNPTGGDLSVMMNSINAAQHSHTFIYRNWEVESKGNMLTHAILRGFVDAKGVNHPNYHYEDLEHLCSLYEDSGLQNPALIVDTNHSNSGKKYLEQVRIAKEVIQSANHNADIRKLLKGMMIESYIEDGCQKASEGTYGKSITDPCLGWEKSERLIYDLAELW